MRKKRQQDPIDPHYYLTKSLTAVRLVFKHPALFIPDLLLLIITGLLTTLFLAVNDLLTPLFINAARLTILRSYLHSLSQSTPQLLQSLATFLALLFVNVVFGISLIATRYAYLKALVTNKKISLWQAYNASRAYFLSLVSIKIVLTLLTFILLTIFAYLALITQSWIFYALVPFIILLTLTRLLFFFAIQDLYLQNSGVHALGQSVRYFLQHPKPTLLALFFVSAVDFSITLLLGFFPAFWTRIAFKLEVLHLTTFVLLLFLAVRVLSSVIVTLWSETFKFLAYKS